METNVLPAERHNSWWKIQAYALQIKRASIESELIVNYLRPSLSGSSGFVSRREVGRKGVLYFVRNSPTGGWGITRTFGITSFAVRQGSTGQLRRRKCRARQSNTMQRGHHHSKWARRCLERGTANTPPPTYLIERTPQVE